MPIRCGVLLGSTASCSSSVSPLLNEPSPDTWSRAVVPARPTTGRPSFAITSAAWFRSTSLPFPHSPSRCSTPSLSFPILVAVSSTSMWLRALRRVGQPNNSGKPSPLRRPQIPTPRPRWPLRPGVPWPRPGFGPGGSPDCASLALAVALRGTVDWSGPPPPTPNALAKPGNIIYIKPF